MARQKRITQKSIGLYPNEWDFVEKFSKASSISNSDFVRQMIATYKAVAQILANPNSTFTKDELGNLYGYYAAYSEVYETLINSEGAEQLSYDEKFKLVNEILKDMKDEKDKISDNT